MLTKVQKWGNSQGLRFPKTVLEEAQINVGDEVNVTVQDGKIIIETANRLRNAYDLKELVSKIPKDYQAEEVDWGRPVGKEEW
jgi:antitoxin MazE